VSDNRPTNCRFRLLDEGKPYPKSGCTACGADLRTLGKSCQRHPMTESSTDSLVERLRGPHRQSECGNFAEVHPDFLNEAASRISTLEQAVDAFADICDELGCERDNEAGLQAAAALTAKVQEAEESNARLLSLIADIRDASGVGAKPMLYELPAAIGRELEEAREQWGLATLALDSMHQNRDAVQRHFDACTIRAEVAETKVERMGEALKPFSVAAGGVFTRNFNASDVLFRKPATASHAESVITAGHLFAARSALQSEKDREELTHHD
jgi:hypothetical protein